MTQSAVIAERGTCGEILIRCLEAQGVTHVFGIPGTHNLSIYEPLATSSISHVTPRHEQGAGYAADAYARVSGRPGVCLTTSGPGLTNIITAAATSYHDSVPTLVISPGMARLVDGRDTGFLHELKSQSGMMDNVVEWSRRVDSVAATAGAVRAAFTAFCHGRPRPVHIELTLDVLGAEPAAYTTEIAVPTPPPPDKATITMAAELLSGAERPCLLLGGGATAASEAARAVAERLGAVVLTTVQGKGTVDERHPLSLGASLRLPAARAVIADADVLLAVGTELSESDLWVQGFGIDGRLIRVDVDPDQLDKNIPASLAIFADAKDALEAIVQALGGSGPGPKIPLGALERAHDLRELIAKELASDGAKYAELLHQICSAAGDDGILVGDSAMPVYYGAVHQFVVARPRRFIYPVGFATLGYAIPGAIGAKLAQPESKTLGLMGDGGAMFSIAELATAVELGLPIPFVVVENGGYGEIRAEMISRGAIPLGVDIGSPDFVGLATAMNAHGLRVDDVTSLGEALELAFEADRPTVLVIDERLLGA